MKISIDNRILEAVPGETVLQCARRNGIRIPSLCFHPATGSTGKCRICVVEVDGLRGLKPSCVLEVAEGMVVRSATDAVMAARKTVVELLLANGEHNCLACERNGSCELQEAAYDLGIEKPRFFIEDDADTPTKAIDATSEMLVMDRRKCISCGRCVSACNTVVVNEVLGTASRGSDTRIVCDNDKPMAESSCVQCGHCSQLCPVGAILDKKSMGKGRSWEFEKIDTTCPYCGVGCQMTLHVDKQANRIVKVTGREVSPNQGMLCVKGRYGYDFPSSPKRLTKPLIKKDGKHVEVSWDEALDYTAAKVKDIVAKHGPDVFSAFGSGRITNENNYAVAKFTRAVIKTNNVDHCART